MIKDLFSWERFWTNFPRILPALSVTFQIVIVVILLGTLWGLLVALIQIRKVPVLYQISKIYVSFFRGTSMLVQLLLIYYGAPRLIDTFFGTNINQTWSKMVFVYIAFVLNEGAFLSAIFYGAITAVNVGQMEAGYSVGLTKGQTYYRIILPQAVRGALPPFGSEFIGLFQSTALVYYIGVTDVLSKAKAVGAGLGHYLEAYLVVAVIFVIISALIRAVFAFLNRHLDYGSARKIKPRSVQQEGGNQGVAI